MFGYRSKLRRNSFRNTGTNISRYAWPTSPFRLWRTPFRRSRSGVWHFAVKRFIALF